MRITTERRVMGAKNTQKSTKTKGSFNLAKSTSASSNSAQIAPANAPETLGALINLQNRYNEASSKSSMAWSTEILDELANIQNQLLRGSFSTDSLQELADKLNHAVIEDEPSQLKDIRSQIVLRARVELAKYGTF